MEEHDKSCIHFAISQGTLHGMECVFGLPTFLCRAAIPKGIRIPERRRALRSTLCHRPPYQTKSVSTTAALVLPPGELL